MSIKNSHELKGLQTRLEKLKVMFEHSKKDVDVAQRALNDTRNKIIKIDNQIKKLKQKEIIISEHAILRFIERAMGFDIELINKKIMENGLEEQIKIAGAGHYPICEGLKAIVKNNTIVSIV